jgi:hypothetical protein
MTAWTTQGKPGLVPAWAVAVAVAAFSAGTVITTLVWHSVQPDPFDAWLMRGPPGPDGALPDRRAGRRGHRDRGGRRSGLAITASRHVVGACDRH